MKEKYVLFIILSGIVLILIFDESSSKGDSHRILQAADSLNLKVYKTYVNHGITEINNGKLIPLNTYLISEKPEWIHTRSNVVDVSDVTPPFIIKKMRNSRKFTISKRRDSLIFQLPDPNYEDPDDLTFREFFDKLLE